MTEMNKRIEDMSLEELKGINNKIISNKELINIDYNENIINVQNLGNSGLHSNCNWYTATLLDNVEIDIYCKRAEEDDDDEDKDEEEELLIEKGFIIEDINYTLKGDIWFRAYRMWRVAAVQEFVYENYDGISLSEALDKANEVIRLMDKNDYTEEEAIIKVMRE